MSNTIEVCKVQNYVAIDKLKFHPNNPRTIRTERLDDLKSSIIEKGFYQPILVWKKGGVVLAGNHRLLAARELIKEGWEFKSPNGETNVLPVVIENVSDEIAEEILFETNNTYADWVEDKLSAAILDAEEKGRDIKKYGFTMEQANEILKKALAEAEGIGSVVGEHTRKLPEPKDVDLSDLAKEEEFESLILSRPVYTALTKVLAEISKTLDPAWTSGYDPAVNVLLQVIDENKIVDGIKNLIEEESKDEEKPKKAKKKRGK